MGFQFVRAVVRAIAKMLLFFNTRQFSRCVYSTDTITSIGGQEKKRYRHAIHSGLEIAKKNKRLKDEYRSVIGRKFFFKRGQDNML